MHNSLQDEHTTLHDAPIAIPSLYNDFDCFAPSDQFCNDLNASSVPIGLNSGLIDYGLDLVYDDPSQLLENHGPTFCPSVYTPTTTSAADLLTTPSYSIPELRWASSFNLCLPHTQSLNSQGPSKYE